MAKEKTTPDTAEPSPAMERLAGKKVNTTLHVAGRTCEVHNGVVVNKDRITEHVRKITEKARTNEESALARQLDDRNARIKELELELAQSKAK